MIGLRKPAVDDHKFAGSLDWVLPIGNMYGHMSVDDMTVFTFHIEGIQYIVCNVFIIAQKEIVSFLFFMRGFVCDKIAFEGGHLALIEERTVGSAP